MGFKALLMGRMKMTTQLEMVSKEGELSLFIHPGPYIRSSENHMTVPLLTLSLKHYHRDHRCPTWYLHLQEGQDFHEEDGNPAEGIREH